MKICSQYCRQTANQCTSSATTCMNGIKKVFRIITWPIRTVYNNKVEIGALAIAGLFVYTNPTTTIQLVASGAKIVAGVALAVSFAATFASGNAAVYYHLTKKDSLIKKEHLLAIAASGIVVSTTCLSFLVTTDAHTIPTSEKIKAVLFIWPFLNVTSGSCLGGLYGYLESKFKQ